jgi:hypothetical protein
VSATTYRFPNTAKCPECDQSVCINRSTGAFRPHGPRANPCPASRTAAHGIHRADNQPTAAQRAALQYCHRIGDLLPVANWLGVSPPDYHAYPGEPHLEREIIWLLSQNRQQIASLLDGHGIEWR